MKKYLIQYKKEILQLFICMSFIMIFWNFALASPYTIKKHIISIIVKTILINGIWLILLILSLNNYVEYLNLKKIQKLIFANKEILITLIIFTVSLFSIFDIWLMGDGSIYYSYLMLNRPWDFGNIFDLQLAGHLTCFYTMWLLIGEYLIPGFAIGVRGIIIILATITVAMFYKILEKIFIHINKINLALFTCLFAFHAAFWGILGEVNADFPVLVFFVWMIYFGINQLYFLQAFSALMLCFSKETGVLIFAFFVFGSVFYSFVKSFKLGFKGIVNKVFSFSNCLMYISGITWFCVWKFNNNGAIWTGGANSDVLDKKSISGVKLDTFNSCYEYIWHKLKEIVFLNNGYIFWILGIIAILCYVFGKNKFNIEKKHMGIVIGIYMSFVGFLNFQMYFLTWPNYRYLIPIAFFEPFLAALFVLGYMKNINKQRVVTIVCVIMIIMSNFGFDPISKSIFQTIDLGNGHMISTNLFYIKDLDNKILAKDMELTYEYAYDDEGVSNREYCYREKCINAILKRIDYTDKKLIIFPYINGAKSFYYGRREGYEFEDLYVNKRTKKLSMNAFGYDVSDSTQWILFNDLYLIDNAQISTELLNSYDEVYYVYPTLSDKHKIDWKYQINGSEVLDSFTIKQCTTGFKILRLK